MFNKVTYYFSFLVSQSLCTYFALMDKSYGINFMKMIAAEPITKRSEFLASHIDVRKNSRQRRKYSRLIQMLTPCLHFYCFKFQICPFYLTELPILLHFQLILLFFQPIFLLALLNSFGYPFCSNFTKHHFVNVTLYWPLRHLIPSHTQLLTILWIIASNMSQ